MGPPLVLLVASTATGVAVVGGACVLLKLNSQRRKKNNKSLVNAKGTNGTHKSSNGDTSEEVQRCLQLVQDLGIIPDLSCLKQVNVMIGGRFLSMCVGGKQLAGMRGGTRHVHHQPTPVLATCDRNLCRSLAMRWWHSRRQSM